MGTESGRETQRRHPILDGKPQGGISSAEIDAGSGLSTMGGLDRVAIFNCYNGVGNKWHKWEPHPKHLAEMPFKRSTLFRPVYCQDNVLSPADDV